MGGGAHNGGDCCGGGGGIPDNSHLYGLKPRRARPAAAPAATEKKPRRKEKRRRPKEDEEELEKRPEGVNWWGVVLLLLIMAPLLFQFGGAVMGLLGYKSNPTPVRAKGKAQGQNSAYWKEVHRNRLVEFYGEHNPDKVAEVDDILAKWEGKEKKLFKMLENKYSADETGA